MIPSPEERVLATHWGIYTAHSQVNKLVELKPLELDANPSKISEGLIDSQTSQTRIKHPAIRKIFLNALEKGRRSEPGERCRGDDAFCYLPWDEAYDIAASEISRVSTEYGNEAIFGGSYGWASAGRFHHAQSQIHRFLNSVGGYTRSVQNYSFGAADVIVPRVIGDRSGLASGHTAWARIAEYTETLVLFGGLSLKNAQVSSGGLSRHILKENLEKLKIRGTRIISISPIRDDTQIEGVEWIGIRPGTDVALMLGIAHFLIISGQGDQAFLDKYTTGFAKFNAYVLGEADGVAKSVDWASEITGIPTEKIRMLAGELSSTRSFLMLAWALQRAEYGEQPCWMLIALASILGQIGLPGGGFGIGYGSVNGIGNAPRATGFPAFPQLTNPVKKFIPVARIADCLLNPGQEFDYDGECHTYPDIKLVYWAGGNPFHHHQDLNRLQKAWERPETIIVNESWWTATARRADIVFPVATSLERNDIACSSRDHFLTPSHQMMRPLAGTPTDYQVFCNLADRLGKGSLFSEGRDEESWLRAMYDQARASNLAKIVWPKFDDFWLGGPMIIPPESSEVNRDLLADYRKNPNQFPLNTPSGRIELFSDTIDSFCYESCKGHPCWMEPSEWLGSSDSGKYPLHLISNQPKLKLHSQLDQSSFSQTGKLNGREIIRLNPRNANERKLQEGATVKVFNERGSCLASLVVSSEVMAGVAQLSTGSWFDPDEKGGLEKHGNPNVLTLDKGTSQLSQATSAMTCLVQVENYAGLPPKVTAFIPPKIVDR